MSAVIKTLPITIADNAATPSKRRVLLGLIGSGIQLSLSPAIHEREGDAHDLRLLYQKIDLDALGVTVEALPTLLSDAERMGFAGLNITFPCKQQILPLLDELSDDARAIGAVNTVLFSNGKRIGHNTDCSGYAASFRREFSDVKREKVVQLGAGGAGSAVANAALSIGVKTLFVYDVDRNKSTALAHALCQRFGVGRAVPVSDLDATMPNADGVINTTPMGMAKYPGIALPSELLRRDLWVSDIVYFPMNTALILAAEAMGCRVLKGGGMMVFQAVEAFRLFTGIEPDPDRMLAHLAQLQATP